jgi:ribosomal protein L4
LRGFLFYSRQTSAFLFPKEKFLHTKVQSKKIFGIKNAQKEEFIPSTKEAINILTQINYFKFKKKALYLHCYLLKN